MKTLIATLAAVAVVGATTQTSHAGDREWATAGNVLTGLAVGSVIASALTPPPVYQAPPPVVYTPAPVYAPAPVVVQPAPVAVVQQPVVVQPAPMVYAPAPVVVYRPAPVYVAPAPVVAIRIGGGYHRHPYGYYHHHGWR